MFLFRRTRIRSVIRHATSKKWLRLLRTLLIYYFGNAILWWLAEIIRLIKEVIPQIDISMLIFISLTCQHSFGHGRLLVTDLTTWHRNMYFFISKKISNLYELTTKTSSLQIGRIISQHSRDKRCTLMDPHTWPCKSRTTNTNIHSAAVWGYGMLSWGPA